MSLKLSSIVSNFGVNQVWTNVTSSRSLGVTYTNSTSLPIQVVINAVTTKPGGAYAATATVGGVTFGIGGTGAYNYQVTGYANSFFVVPPNLTYSISIDGTNSLSSWYELR